MKIIKSIFQSEIKDINEDDRTLTALVSTNAMDRMDEVLDPDGADLKAYRKNPVVLWAHRYDVPPIGKALWIKKTEDGIMSKVQFAATQFADEIFSLFRDGFLKAFSVGFVPKKWEFGQKEGEPRKTYKEWELIEYSAVPVPANPEALALAIQKGILKDNTLIKSFGIPEKKEEDKEKKEDEEGIAADKSNIEFIEMLEAELEQAKIEHEVILKGKDAEIVNLKYQIYKLVEVNKELKQARQRPEITGDMLSKMIGEQMTGVIRRLTGKVS